MKHNISTKQKRLGWSAGLLMSLLGRKPESSSDAELYKKDFHPNTRKMGLHFPDKVRKVFRRSWLRLR